MFRGLRMCYLIKGQMHQRQFSRGYVIPRTIRESKAVSYSLTTIILNRD